MQNILSKSYLPVARGARYVSNYVSSTLEVATVLPGVTVKLLACIASFHQLATLSPLWGSPVLRCIRPSCLKQSYKIYALH
jgi:hypothetical protein